MNKVINSGLEQATTSLEVRITTDGDRNTYAEIAWPCCFPADIGVPAGKVYTGVARTALGEVFDIRIGAKLAMVRALDAWADDLNSSLLPEDQDVSDDWVEILNANEVLTNQMVSALLQITDLSEALGENVESELVDHAIAEMAAVGLYDEDSDYGGMIGRSVEQILRVMAAQKHSGMSNSIVMDLVNRLRNHEALTPLTDSPDEWEDRSEQSGTPLWQNRRDPRMFSTDRGATYYNIADVGIDGETATYPSEDSTPPVDEFNPLTQ